MIEIHEGMMLNPKRAERLMRGFNSGRYQFDSEGIRADIVRLREEATRDKNKIMAENKKRIALYLENVILPNLNRYNRIKVKWYVDSDYRTRTAPIQLVSMKWCGFDIIDYTYKTEERIVSLSYKNAWDAMAFVIAHEDLGVSMAEIEEVLTRRDCGILKINPEKKLEGLYDDNCYSDVNMMRIGETEYVDKYREGAAKDYFGAPVSEVTYKEILGSSIRKLMVAVITGILGGVPRDKYNLEFLGIFENTIYFNTNMSTPEIEHVLAQSIAIRMFGRQFEFRPKTVIY